MELADQCFIRKPDSVTRNIAGETIIVPVRGHVGDLASIYTLNEVGTTIWELIDGERSVQQIVEAVCEEYDVTLEQANKDVAEFVGSLQEAGLIRPAQADAD